MKKIEDNEYKENYDAIIILIIHLLGIIMIIGFLAGMDAPFDPHQDNEFWGIRNYVGKREYVN
jgi:hypothetical protein